MGIFTVQRRAGPAAGASPSDSVLIKEGFCWPALFVPTLWAISNRLWLVLLFLYVLALALIFVADFLPGSTAFAIYVLGRFYFAVEANGLRRWTYARNGYDLVGIVAGRDLEEAERRYFLETLPPPETASPTEPTPLSSSHALADSAMTETPATGASR